MNTKLREREREKEEDRKREKEREREKREEERKRKRERRRCWYFTVRLPPRRDQTPALRDARERRIIGRKKYLFRNW